MCASMWLRLLVRVCLIVCEQVVSWVNMGYVGVGVFDGSWVGAANVIWMCVWM